MARISKIDKEKRVIQVIKEIARGTPYREIILMCRESWGIKERMAKAYIHAAYEVLARVEDRKSVRVKAAEAKARYDSIYRRAVITGDLTAARQAQDSICKLAGLFVERLEHKHELGDSMLELLHKAGNGKADERTRARLGAITGEDSS